MDGTGNAQYAVRPITQLKRSAPIIWRMVDGLNIAQTVREVKPMSDRTGMLQKIIEWPADDLDGLMEYVCQEWKYAECGYFGKSEDGIYHLSTAGWSDNEETISAMQDNYAWWAIHWQSSRRGGHYEFGRER